MSANELLGSDNRNRLKELAKGSFSEESILKDLASDEPSCRRDAALILFHHACKKAPNTEGSAFIEALAETLKQPRAREGIDVHAWATCAEATLAALHPLVEAGADRLLEEDFLLPLIPYTEVGRPWNTDAAASTAKSLVDGQLSGEKKQDFVTRVVLQRYLRPLFSKSTSSVTAEGRPALFREPPPPNGGFHEQKAAWKDAGPHVVTVFAWAVEASEPSTIKQHWPLYVPVLVTLAEDGDVAVRQCGLDVLGRFLAACPAEVLRASGVDAVFEASVLPSLLFLPSLTPEAESVPLLRAAYHVLHALALAAGADDPAAARRRALLDRTLREGVFAGYFHASQHVRVVEVLMRAAAEIVQALEVYAVKHLQSLLDLFTPVLTDAFALAYPPAVLAAAQALNTTILNCWPRIIGTPHAEHIISIASRCWINVHDQDSGDWGPELESLADELSKTMMLVATLWKESDEVIPVEKLARIVQKAPSLKPLFAPFRLEKSTA
ncbi:hypothetical protein ISF_07612 [Cordyceps fumosorosea ARSEF 2679]|uniref:Armadillo-type fold protein n=1 Tax=Cordyceps fumosorosea (strain ARSEF 2679) TaxID=1081104 RepID=A0A167NWF0_CORFA|nr:hypothetical protein ISF_07612 [Cordyceps fumosorosea ARSEF 2679]OAA56014.1 hypothetical protein ISF_07612 [Cordyceps fumosorosea ARSEF 2679]